MTTETKTKTTKSLKVSCPHCHDGDSVTLDLNALQTISCGGCGEEFSAAKAAALFQAEADKWAAVAAWIAAAPAV